MNQIGVLSNIMRISQHTLSDAYTHTITHVYNLYKDIKNLQQFNKNTLPPQVDNVVATAVVAAAVVAEDDAGQTAKEKVYSCYTGTLPKLNEDHRRKSLQKEYIKRIQRLKTISKLGL